MHKIIKGNAIIDDSWQVIAKDHQGDLPKGNLLLPVDLWLKNQNLLDTAKGNIGLWLESDDDVASLGSGTNNFPVIAINFPVFADGRGFSLAQQLRGNLGFNGELRAIGSPMRDQLFFLKRCGFDAFDFGPEVAEEYLSSLNDFSVTYQASANQPEPLFRRK